MSSCRATNANLASAAKAVRDGIADALGLASDRDPRVVWCYRQQRHRPPAVWITIAVGEDPARVAEWDAVLP